MKKISTYLSICLLIAVTSCSSDDDRPQGYFPTTIEKIDFTNSGNNRTIELEYNNQNQISRVEIINPSGNNTIKTLTYTDNKLTQTVTTNSGDSETRNYIYNASGILSSIVEIAGGSTLTYPITYDETTNSYTLVDGADNFSIFLNSQGNAVRYENTFFADLILTLDNNLSGTFKFLEPQIAYQFEFALFSGMDFYYMSTQQINRFEFGVQDLEPIHTRNQNDMISTVIYNLTGGGGFQYTFTYSNRNL